MSAPVTSATSAPVLTVATREIPDPGDLIATLPHPEGALAWVRRGEGFVAWGEAARFDGEGATRMLDADAWWSAVTGSAQVTDPVGLPGSGLLALGAFGFDDDSSRPGGLVVPRVVVGRRSTPTGVRAWVTTITPDGAAPPLPEAPAGAGVLVGAGVLPGAVEPHAYPRDVTWSEGSLTAAEWMRRVAGAIARIREGEAHKIVLARDVWATSAEPLDVRVLAARFAQAYSTTWTFAVDGLVGATPELLVRRERGLVASRVLAGTIRRTGDDEADLAHAAALARSSKDLEEHEFAVASLAESLEPFVASANVPEVPSVLHLPNVMHLATDVTGVLEADGEGRFPSVLRVAAALHPTAAVGGTPRAVAVSLVNEIEGMDRGRYAGPVGWLGADGDGEFCIALRCGSIDRDDARRIRLFAGCGIVAASDPRAELDETEAKLEPMRQALLG